MKCKNNTSLFPLESGRSLGWYSLVTLCLSTLSIFSYHSVTQGIYHLLQQCGTLTTRPPLSHCIVGMWCLHVSCQSSFR